VAIKGGSPLKLSQTSFQYFVGKIAERCSEMYTHLKKSKRYQNFMFF